MRPNHWRSATRFADATVTTEFTRTAGDAIRRGCDPFYVRAQEGHSDPALRVISDRGHAAGSAIAVLDGAASRGRCRCRTALTGIRLAQLSASKWSVDSIVASEPRFLYGLLCRAFLDHLHGRQQRVTSGSWQRVALRLCAFRCFLRSDEQRRIAAYLDEQTAKIDTLIAETERFIELARERRAALITAAVTGQIDVREMA